MSEDLHKEYWTANLKFLSIILVIWFLVSLGCGVLFKEQLDVIKIGNAPFGFWMSQQGAIICFILLLITYMIGMNKLDAKYGYDKEDEE